MVFFSGTDTDELKANCQNHDMYFSIIVNNDLDICAKAAICSTTTKLVEAKDSFLSTDGKNYVIKHTDTQEELKMRVINFDIECSVENVEVDKIISERVELLLNPPAKVVPLRDGYPYGRNSVGYDKTSKHSYNKGYPAFDESEYYTRYYGYDDDNFSYNQQTFDIPDTSTPKKEKLNIPNVDDDFDFGAPPDDTIFTTIEDTGVDMSQNIKDTFSLISDVGFVSDTLKNIYCSQFEGVHKDFEDVLEAVHIWASSDDDDISTDAKTDLYIKSMKKSIDTGIIEIISFIGVDYGIELPNYTITEIDEFSTAIAVNCVDYIDFYLKNNASKIYSNKGNIFIYKFLVMLKESLVEFVEFECTTKIKVK